MKLDQDQVITEFLNRYNLLFGTNYSITAQPDKIKQRVAKTSREIDAIATSPGMSLLAIEHTIIETRHNQKTTDAYFERTFEKLESDLKNANFGFSLGVAIPHGGLKLGDRWDEIAVRIYDYVFDTAVSLPMGTHEPGITGVPFQIIIDKRPAAPDGSVFCGTMRYGLKTGLHDEIKQIILQSLINKSEPMKKYASNHCTLLLLETQDIAMMAPDIFARCFNAAATSDNLAEFEQVWMITVFKSDVLGTKCLHHRSNPSMVFDPDKDPWI